MSQRTPGVRVDKTLPANNKFSIPPDQVERSRALDPSRSFLVQAPAGSGKTELLIRRYLRLLAQVESPDEIVAITFTNAAAAEMRQRILDALEEAESKAAEFASIPGLRSETWATQSDPEGLSALAARALEQARRREWRILDRPGQLRIMTIDAFCRSLALQCPLSWGPLSSLGGRLETAENPKELYRRAARRTLESLGGKDSPTRRSIEAFLLWRDNNWNDVEELIVEMLKVRNLWYKEFVFAREGDWTALRRQLESPFRRAARRSLWTLGSPLDGLPECRDYALKLARAACETPGKSSPLGLAERAELPVYLAAADLGLDDAEEALQLEDAIAAYRDLACFLLTKEGEWRKKSGLTVHHGFPPGPVGKAAKDCFGEFVDGLGLEPGLLSALAAFLRPMPLGYTDEEWERVRDCFAVLRNAAGQLKLVFAETGAVDFTEVAQIASEILAAEDGTPSDFAIRQADSIRHLLIDEFQDTSRNQHQLLSRIIAAWPEREGRSCFCVGDPMQSIYSFREAEVELFDRARTNGLEISGGVDAAPFRFDFVSLRANFRTTPGLVEDLNVRFEGIFAEDDGSGVGFFPAEPVRGPLSATKTELHLAFSPSGRAANSIPLADPEETRADQVRELVALIESKLLAMDAARAAAFDNPEARPGKYRMAVLARTRKSLIPIAEALREAGIDIRAVDLVKLRERPEVLDALSLARALLNPIDRTAWLGVLRAPWCGLSLAELYWITSADDAEILATPIPTLLESRLPALLEEGRIGARGYSAANRVARAMRRAVEGRASAAGSALGTWLESVWKALGGADTVGAEERQNLRLLWASLDGLPEGDLDLVGPGLDAALEELYALPDPAASSDFGVQLMTIHKSKGLEFEVVIVPDLEAESKKGERRMISWLERGLASSDEAGELTEFLIAPIQPKGAEGGTARKWVESEKRKRETQELRRVLYVAATRAREELHLFARPRFKINQASGAAGPLELANPTGLLKTAWPAFGQEVETRFLEWAGGLGVLQSAEEGGTVDLAAGTGDLVEMPKRVQPAPTLLRRLPEDYAEPEVAPFRGKAIHGSVASEATDYEEDSGLRPLYARSEGGLQSRLAGIAIHAFLEHLTRLRETLAAAEAAQKLGESLPQIAAILRGRGLAAATALRLTEEALAMVQRAFRDPVCAWILAPHSHAETESRWTGSLDGPASTLRNLRPDRVFFAVGPETAGATASEPVWWIIDYKTGHEDATKLEGAAEREAFLSTHRARYRGQLQVYAQVLRRLRGDDGGGDVPFARISIRAGIFYPRLLLFDDWAE